MNFINKIFKSTFEKTIEDVGYNKLTSSFRRYLMVYMCFMIATLLSNTYFNVFLLKVIGGANALVLYNLLLACFQPVVMVLSIRILRWKSVNYCQQLGLGMHALAYLILTFSVNVSESMVYIISCLFSAGNAFYYTSYTPQILAYTSDDTRDVAYGSMGLVSTVWGLILPIITGFFISAFGDLVGYHVMFFFSAFTLIGGILLSFRLKKVKAENKIPSQKIYHIMKRMVCNRDMFMMMVITMLTAAEISGKAYYGSVLVYELLGEEAVIGVVTAVGGLVSILANLVYGKVVKSGNRGLIMMLGTIALLVSTVMLNFYKTSFGYIIYFMIYSFSNFFISTPVVTEYMRVLQKDDTLKLFGAEVHTCREFFYAFGRALGLIPAFFISPSVSSASAILILIVVLQLLSAIIMLKINKKQS